jgi:hypothetical protein
MNIVKGILLMFLIGALSSPCFGSGVAIKRKKNKWLFPKEFIKNINVDCNNQRYILLFIS